MKGDTEAMEPRAALERAKQARAVTARRGTEVHGLVESLTKVLEENHFSVRLARAFGLEDDRP